jgi:hypothetical protein
VCPSYSGGVAYSNDGEVLKVFQGGGDDLHFANFVAAVRSGKRDALNGDIEQGHLSSAMCHLGNISHRLGGLEWFTKKPQAFNIKSADEAMASMIEHLKKNKIDVEGLKYHLGRKLTIDPRSETFVGDREADAMLTREYRSGFEVPEKV